MDRIASIESEQLKKDLPGFKSGDTLRVHLKIPEGDKTRIQIFEGIVISKKGKGIRATFKVRRISYGEGVERSFSLHSPLIERIEVIKRGKVRRAKLYYLRNRVAPRVEERVGQSEVGKESPLPGLSGSSGL